MRRRFGPQEHVIEVVDRIHADFIPVVKIIPNQAIDSFPLPFWRNYFDTEKVPFVVMIVGSLLDKMMILDGTMSTSENVSHEGH